MFNTKKTALGFVIAAACAAPVQASGVQAFLDSLRDFESGINPALADFYLENLDNPVYTYAQVTEPGRLVRDCSTGEMISEPTTISDFFKKLGIDGIYNPDTPNDPAMFREMQYNSMNAWGFIGYQLGEALLIDSGYYSPTTAVVDGVEYDSFYMFVPDSTWIGCKTEALAEIEGSGGNKVYVTDNNLWEGTFVGKNGVNSLADLRLPEKQELVIRDAMHFNYKVLTKLLSDANMTWEQALNKSWPGEDDNGRPIEVKATMSGLLAAAHLRGAWGTGALLTKDQITCDELGTCITKYVYKFGGFDTIFDVPGDSTTHGSPYPEVLTAGWGNDTVITGGGSDKLMLNEQQGSTTTVVDFTVGDDLVVLSGWNAADPLANLVVAETGEGAELQFAGQRVVLNGVSASSVQANPADVIVKSNIYPLAWRGKSVVDNFDPNIDKIEGTSGIGFKHLKAYQTENSVIIGPQAQDGGIYAYYELTGLTLADLRPDMFVNVTGSFDRLGFIVPLNHINWGWNMELVVGSFDVSKTVLTVPSNNPVPFASLQLVQQGADTVISLVEPYAKGDKKKIILKNTEVGSLSANNFAGFTGDFSEVTVDNPVFFDITVTVDGLGGSVSPTPDANGVIKGKGGTDFTINFTADQGYAVKAVIVDGQVQPASGSYTFTALSGAHTVSVSFEKSDNPTPSCPANWDPDTVYTGGEEVLYQQNIYRAQWWNKNVTPGGQWGPWDLIGPCE